MQWKIHFIIVLMSIMVCACIAQASENKSVLATQVVNDLARLNQGPIELNEAIKIYLEKNPPTVISEFMYAKIEKSMPASIPEGDREKALSKIKENVTPDVLTKMISAGLKRNFTASEINVLAKYDDSALSEELKKKNDIFRFEVASEIRLLIAATSG